MARREGDGTEGAVLVSALAISAVAALAMTAAVGQMAEWGAGVAWCLSQERAVAIVGLHAPCTMAGAGLVFALLSAMGAAMAAVSSAPVGLSVCAVSVAASALPCRVVDVFTDAVAVEWALAWALCGATVGLALGLVVRGLSVLAARPARARGETASRWTVSPARP